ncbi:outer membrane lipoprotein-sorting protein [bacterium]|nr:outer membrane lipoprotein-sorting protein [bacterium]
MRIIISLLLLSGIFTAVSAQELADILKSAHEHHQALRDSIRDMFMIREATIFSGNDTTGILFTKMTRGELVREETTTLDPDTSNGNNGPVSVIELFDCKSEWQVNALQGKVRMGGGGRRFQSPAVEYWIDPPENSVILGSEIMHNRDCWIIESIPTPAYNYSRVWIDKEYYMMIRVESWDEQHNPTVVENTNLWYVLDDFAIPSRTVIKKQWRPAMELVIKELRVNQGLPDSLFDADKLP